MIQVSKVQPFQAAIRAVASFISEANFRFNENGLSLKAIDPSQIVLVSYTAPKDFFSKFSVEPALIGLDMEELNKVVKRASLTDTLSISIEDSFLSISVSGTLERTFKLPLIDVLEEDPEIPEIQHDAKIEIQARLLQEALKDAALFESSVVLRVENSKLFIEARGSHGMLKTEAKHQDLVKVKAKANVVGKYSLNFLENIVREADPNEMITMELKNETPMKISYNIGSTKIQFYLAHMIL
ncbi:MAG: hypothetical protein N3F05_02545 [Candidatus Diapherotrites archaeon]|nr:hypothetical protein [Candidatus Diapherotrites archaeon]